MPRRTHDDSIETKKKILESAQRLFTRRGYERTSLSDVAKYAGVTRGAIYWHFENKEELLISLIDFLETEKFSLGMLNEASLATEPNPLMKLKNCVKSIASEEITQYINSTFLSMIISIMNGVSGNSDVRQKLIELTEMRRNLLVKAFKNCIAKGQLPANLSINDAVEHLSMFVIGYIDQARLTHAENIAKNFDFYIDLEFDLIRKLTSDVI